MIWIRISLSLVMAAFCLAGQTVDQPLELSLEKAVDLALAPDGNARYQIALELVNQAKARSDQARGYLLPNIDGTWSYSNFTRNLEAFGVSSGTPISIPGFGIPSFVGPLSNFDRRVSATQTVFDLSAIRRYQAARTNITAAKHDVEAARQQAAAAVAKAYVATQRAEQAYRTAQANVELATRTLKLAISQKNAGTGTGIDVTRAEVLVANERQKLLQTEEDRNSARLQLLRGIGLPFATAFNLTTSMDWKPVDIPEPKAAMELAAHERPELLAQAVREDVARLNNSAVKSERLPSVGAFGDYGNLGTEWATGRATRIAGVQVKIPIFDGGRRDARRAESASLLRQEALRTRDTRQQVELEVRTAIDAMRSAESLVKAAVEALALAEKELAQAERRFSAGVAPGFEVTDAQTRLARARESHVSALFKHRAARIDYGLATGALEPALQ